VDIVPLPADEAPVRRYVEKLWIPYHREREELVDLVAEEVTHRLNRHETERYLAWTAVDAPREADELADIDGAFAGFVTTDLDESPSVFDRLDRLVGDV
jgi:hypothetical protein